MATASNAHHRKRRGRRLALRREAKEQATSGSRVARRATGPSRARRRSGADERSGDERAWLLNAVARLMGQRKTAVVSLRQAADRAGISHSALRRQFGTKSGLLTAYAAEGFDRLAQTITEHLGRRRPRDGAGVLEAVGNAYIRFAQEHPEQFEVMFGSERVNFDEGALAAASNRAWGMLTSTIERCVAEGRLRPVDGERAAVASWALVHGLAALWNGAPRRDHHLGRRTPEQLAATVNRLFVEALVGSAARQR